MIMLEQAKRLRYGQTVYHVHLRNSDDSPYRFKVNGQPITWKRNTSAVRVPIKRGLREYAYLDETNLNEFCLTREEALLLGKYDDPVVKIESNGVKTWLVGPENEILCEDEAFASRIEAEDFAKAVYPNVHVVHEVQLRMF